MVDRVKHIETLRGIAILLVVIGHVIGIDAKGGMKVADDSFLRYLYDLFENMRMPLFTVISGWVYSLHPVTKGTISIFIQKKARRLLFPLFFVGTSYFLLQYIIPGTNQKGDIISIWKIYIYPYTIYWYLPALFLVFICVAICDTIKILTSKYKFFFCFLVATLLCIAEVSHFISASVPNYFAFKNALYLLPFFLLGIGLNRFNNVLCSVFLKKIYLIGFIVGVLLQQAHYFFPQETYFYEKLHFAIFIGMIASAYLINLHINNQFFVYFAKYAYAIYLFHGFGTSGGRIILNYLGINNQLLILFTSTAIALFGSILTEYILIKWKVTRLLLLGKKQ